MSARADEAEQVPKVAIHVSDYTNNLHGTPGSPGSVSDPQGWYYDSFWHFQAHTMLEESLRSDGTPFAELSDGQIEAGSLLANGKPRYPIFFSVMAECVSDIEVQAIRQYVAAGGTAYVAGSSWIRGQNGLYRVSANGTAEFALSREMGLESVPVEDKPQGGTWSWVLTNRIWTNSNDSLVSHLPKNTDLVWPLPKNYDSDAYDMYRRDEGVHWAWLARRTSDSSATVLAVMKPGPGYAFPDAPLLATKAYGAGRFIYQSEMAPLAGWGGYAPDISEYVFVRRAIEQAFNRQNLPLPRISAWRYPYKAALQTRWDMDWYPGDLQNLTSVEKSRGFAGQYNFVTSLANDGGAWIRWARDNGASIGSHNKTHVGPDQQSAADADANIGDSLDSLQGWAGLRPTNWVSPKYQSIKDESFQALVNNGIETAGEQNVGPFPHFALSMKTPGYHYDLLEIPTTEWVPASAVDADVRARMEQLTSTQITDAMDFSYGLGGLINIYGHPYSSNESRLATYLDHAQHLGDIWMTDATHLYDWWGARDTVSIAPDYVVNDNTAYLTVGVSGNADPNQGVDIALPESLDPEQSLGVSVDGVPSTQYRRDGLNLKVLAGTASSVEVTWVVQPPMLNLTWTQTTQSDFGQGAASGVDTSTSPGEQMLAAETGGGPFFVDDFSRLDWTTSQWSTQTGLWGIDGDTCTQSETLAGYKLQYAGKANWTDYAVEARSRLVNGSFGGHLAGRLNPSTGARYSLWLYPSTNQIKLIKFSDWTSWSQLGGTRSVPAIGDTWHALKLEFQGSRIRAYYDGVLYFDLTDGAYAEGAIALETYGSEVDFDDVRVSRPGTVYVAEGTMQSVPFDACDDAIQWKKIKWVGTVPTGTQVALRTRTAATKAGLDASTWSEYYAGREDTITSPALRWIQYEVSLSSSDGSSTPLLGEVSVNYRRPPDVTPPAPPGSISVEDAGTGSTVRLAWANPSDADFDHIHIYRSTASGVLGDLVYDDVKVTEKADTSLINGITYYYVLRSVDRFGNESMNTDQHAVVPTGLVQNAALSFDSIDDAVVVPDAPSLDVPGALTVEAFVRISSFANRHGIIVSRADGNDISWDLYYDSAGRVYWYVRKPDNSGYVQGNTTAGVLRVGAWQHVAGVVDPASQAIYIYVDGVRQDSTPYTYAGAKVGSARLCINAEAASSDGNTWPGNAVLDEVRVSKTARYTFSSFAVPTAPFVSDSLTTGLWHFDEGSGTSTRDGSPNANDGSFRGDPEWVAGYLLDVVAPTVRITEPPSDAVVSETVTVAAMASDNVGVERVEFYVNGILDHTDNSWPYIYQWNTAMLRNGPYVLSARAYDPYGNVGISGAVIVSVLNVEPPTSFALSFDAVDDAVVVPDSASLDAAGAITVEAWIKINSFPRRHGIIVSRVDGADISWDLYYDDSGRAYWYVRNPDDSGYAQANTGQQILTLGAWHHVAGVINPTGNQIAIYVDGTLRDVTSFGYAGAKTGAARLVINEEAAAVGETWPGDATIDEVRFSHVARYAGTSFSVPTAPFATDADTVGLWHFDEGYGGTAYDSSANSNDGMFKGDPEWVSR